MKCKKKIRIASRRTALEPVPSRAPQENKKFSGARGTEMRMREEGGGGGGGGVGGRGGRTSLKEDGGKEERKGARAREA